MRVREKNRMCVYVIMRIVVGGHGERKWNFMETFCKKLCKLNRRRKEEVEEDDDDDDVEQR